MRRGPVLRPALSRFQASFFFPLAVTSHPSNAPYPTLTSGLQAMPQVLPRLIDHIE